MIDNYRAYLNTLPVHIKLNYQVKVVMAHGSTRSIDKYVLEDFDEKHLLETMAEAGADVLCIGHSHKPYHRIIGNSKHVINVGSVGKSKDGNPQGCYVIIQIVENGNFHVNFQRFYYY